MRLQHSIAVLALLPLLAHAEAAAPTGDDEVVVTPSADCRHYGDKTWTLTREARLPEILKTLSDLTCERFFLPRNLLGEKATIDVGHEPLSSAELHQRVEGALRSRGIVLEYAPAAQVRRASDRRPSPPIAPIAAIPNERLEKGIQCSANRCTIARSIVDDLLGNMTQLASSARMVPSFKDGKAVGFRLFSIRPDSLYAHLLLQNGDTLTAIDGLELGSPDKALEAYTHLKGKSQLKVDLERRGQKLTMEYVIK